MEEGAAVSSHPIIIVHPASLMDVMDISSVKKLNLYLIRHAESNNNLLYDAISSENFAEEESKLREADCGISQTGQEQVRRLHEYIANGGFADIAKSPFTVYTSPMKRCLETALAISSGIPQAAGVRVYPELYESGGSYVTVDGSTVGVPGTTSADVAERYPGFICEEGMENGWYHRDHKETNDEFDTRAAEVVSWIWRMLEKPGADGLAKSVVIVMHGNLMSAVMNGLLFGSQNTRAGLFLHCNTGITHMELVEVAGRRVGTVQCSNHTPHLMPKESEEENLRTGNDLFKHQWIQEFL